MGPRSRRGSARRPTTRRATTFDGAGTTRASRPWTATRSCTRARARTRPTSSAANTSCAAVSGRTQPARAAGPAPAGLARHPRPARPGRPRREGRPRAQRAVRGLRTRRRPHRGPGSRARVDADPRLGRGHVARRLPRAVGPRHRRPVRRRARAGRPQVHAHRLRPPVLADPLGFAGLAKVPPPSRAPAVLEQRIKEIEAERDGVRSEAEAIAGTLPGLGEEVAALREAMGLDRYARRTSPSSGRRRRSSPGCGHGTSS